ncbi:Rcs stress response system protein RcsF [Candidatus Symbiopectobacterium sp. 'North America']|uniref:Rcs stress response system protein RcsF n=1 Tax=Candidatus Symbiopectobacterium sp. 'North America' TaxID=2794574 RepID=UPI0018CAC2A3|nr:Rcs stress response system protein RcsF [Candidatus Symbiopectobacterium sp. 'North America']MBG6245715.1 Rcs stress response system protein RcsF [Candidatus Symbiopectobacterium sp. 'North America']
MRAIPLVFLALSLTGCSLLQPKTAPAPQPVIEPAVEAPAKAKPAPRPATAVLYNNAEELVGKPFRDMGEVSGSVCQASVQDTPATVANARRRLQTRATAMRANAVLVHNCQVVSGVAGCYRQAICEGTALKISSQ